MPIFRAKFHYSNSGADFTAGDVQANAMVWIEYLMYLSVRTKHFNFLFERSTNRVRFKRG